MNNSKSKLPIFNTQKRVPERKVLRRSASCSDLKTTVKVNKQPMQCIQEETSTSKVQRTTNKLLRSNSSNELKMQASSATSLISRKPLRVVQKVVPPKPQPNPRMAVALKPSTTATAGTKRLAPADKLTIPPKISKPSSSTNLQTSSTSATIQKTRTKPAPYDYKARYNNLLEDYKELKSNYNACKVKMEKFDEISSENDALKEINDNLNKKMVHFEQKTNDLEEHKKMLTQNLSVVTEELNKVKNEQQLLREEYSNLEDLYKKTKNDNEMHQNKLIEKTTVCDTLQTENTFMKARLAELENNRRVLHNKIQDLKGNIRVFCRIRPVLSTEAELTPCNIDYLNETTVSLRKSRESKINSISSRTNDLSQQFTYDLIFSPNSSQAEVFEELSHLVQSALDGYNVCVFAYGQTGSGKTYTMQGGNELDSHGMIPRSIKTLFERISELSRIGWRYTVSVSFLEIYNESIKDLLNINSSLPHNILYNDGKGVKVTNVKIETVSSIADVYTLMRKAERNRSVATTNYNEHSSRSHAVTKIYLVGVHEESRTVYESSLNLVDLAGSESAKTTTTERLLETKHINKSLAALANVLLALHNCDKHIPYRDSKLTYLMQSCLGGDSKVLMFVNVSPLEECYNESINSLRFAAKVKEVKTNAKRTKTCI